MAGPARFMGGGPIERSMDFKGSVRRLISLMRPDRFFLYLVLALGTVSVALSVTGPYILGRATDLIFAGVVGQQGAPVEGRYRPAVTGVSPPSPR